MPSTHSLSHSTETFTLLNPLAGAAGYRSTQKSLLPSTAGQWLIPSPLTCLAAQNRVDAAKLAVGNSPCLVSVLWGCVGIVEDNELLQAAAAPGTGLAE